jgi:hypothetical protein
MLRAWLADALSGRERFLVATGADDLTGLTAVGAALDLQAELVLVTDDDAATVTAAVDAHRPSFAFSAAAPLPAGNGQNPVRAWITAGPAEAADSCVGWRPPNAAGMVACNPVNGVRRPQSRGLPLPGAEVRALGPDGYALPSGREGRLDVRAPNLPSPEQWEATGERGWLDAEGYVFVQSS